MSVIYSDPLQNSPYAGQQPQAGPVQPSGISATADAARRINQGQALINSGSSGLPATPLQGVSRLVQALAGSYVKDQGTDALSAANPNQNPAFGGMAQQGNQGGGMAALMSYFGLGGSQ